MSEFRLDEKTKKNIEFLAKQTAKSLAKDAREKLTDKYIELIDWYYVDYSPKLNKYDEPYYTRSFRLYKSYSKYYKNLLMELLRFSAFMTFIIMQSKFHKHRLK